MTWRLVSLDDVHPLWGGVALRIAADGAATVDDYPRGARDPQRRTITLRADLLAELDRLLAALDVRRMQIPDRPGIPDEARPTITVAFADGTTHAVSKWAGVVHPAFGALYTYLRAAVSAP